MVKFVHFYRADDDDELIDRDVPQAHVYINPANVACLTGRSATLTTIEYWGGDGECYETVEGAIADVVRLLEEGSY